MIMGYPPFLKSLADNHDFDWAPLHRRRDLRRRGDHRSDAATTCRRPSCASIGSYGASDLEINIAYETEFTIALREALATDEALRNELVKDFGSLPSVFQYDPLDYYIESNERNELLFTLNRPSTIAPKVRYNIHDVGHTLRYRDAIAAIQRAGRTDIIEHLRARGVRLHNLPLLFHYGRSDLSVSFFGATVSPDGIRQALHAIPALDGAVESFQAFNAQNENDDPTLVVAVELASGRDKATFDSLRRRVAVRRRARQDRPRLRHGVLDRTCRAEARDPALRPPDRPVPGRSQEDQAHLRRGRDPVRRHPRVADGEFPATAGRYDGHLPAVPPRANMS